MRTSLELPDPLFARLNATPAGSGSKRSAQILPRVEGPLAIEGQQLSNAALFDLLDA
jgi:hypothetical protein